jgi:hypothetical protein
MRKIIHIFELIVKNWYTDTDLIYENNRDVVLDCHRIIVKYKTHDSRVKHITQELVDRNYIKDKEDEISCREFLRWYFTWKSE